MALMPRSRRPASLVPIVGFQWRDVRPRSSHDFVVSPRADYEMKANLHDGVPNEHVRAPTVTCDRGQSPDKERRHVERGNHTPDP
jgi:hypothetical protein